MRLPAHVHVMSIQPPTGKHPHAFAYFDCQPSKKIIRETLDRYFSVGPFKVTDLNSLIGHRFWIFSTREDAKGPFGVVEVSKVWYEGRRPEMPRRKGKK